MDTVLAPATQMNQGTLSFKVFQWPISRVNIGRWFSNFIKVSSFCLCDNSVNWNPHLMDGHFNKFCSRKCIQWLLFKYRQILKAWKTLKFIFFEKCYTCSKEVFVEHLTYDIVCTNIQSPILKNNKSQLKFTLLVKNVIKISNYHQYIQ